MASRKLFYGRPSYIYPYPETDTSQNDQNLFEFDESDFYNQDEEEQFSTSLDSKKPIPISRSSRKPAKTGDPSGVNRKTKPVSASLPVNVPDWSKILKNEYRCPCKRDSDEEDDEDGEDDGGAAVAGVRTPPHEYLARRRGSSFSVHEGNGRTLKGRDLWKLRNAIWEKTGFQD